MSEPDATPDSPLVASWLGVKPTPDQLAAWCRVHLSAEPSTLLFEEQHLSFVTGLRLTDGRAIVVKARPASARIAEGLRVQQFMWSTSYPCPRPLAGPAPLANFSATAETLILGGTNEVSEDDRPALFAAALHGFIRAAASFSEPIALRPPLPWVGWDHEEQGLWPSPDDLNIDLNQLVEDAWLDDIGRRAQARLLRDESPRVIGHADWWPPNLRWLDGRLHVVFDWDSLACLSEAALAGAAAAQYADRWPAVTTIDQCESFIDAYATARGQAWSHDELEVCWAAGSWLMAFNAKKQSYEGVMESYDHLRFFGEERLRRAGA